MGNYVDKDRKIKQKSNTEILNEIDPNRKIYKIVALKNIDDKRIVFFSQYITSSNTYGVVTNTSGLNISIASSSTTFNSTTINWNAQNITIPPSVYGIIGIDYATSLAGFYTGGLFNNVIPLAVIGSETHTIPFLFQFTKYGTYICYTYQAKINDKWEWSNEPTYIIGTGSDIRYSDTSTNTKYITFIRNGSTLRRQLQNSTASDWDFYPDYIDNANVRYLMPTDKALQVTSNPSGNPTTSPANIKALTNYGTYGTMQTVVDNPYGQRTYTYHVRLPLFNPYIAILKKYVPHNYKVVSNNGTVKLNDTYNNSILQKITVDNDEWITLTLNASESIITNITYMESFEESMLLNMIPITVSDSNTEITVENAVSGNTQISPQASTFTITGEIFFDNKYVNDTLEAYIGISISNTPTSTSFTITSEIFFDNKYVNDNLEAYTGISISTMECSVVFT